MGKTNEKLVLTPEELRLELGISRGLCYESLRLGKIRSFRLGRRILIPYAELKRLMEATSEASTETNISDR